MRVAISNHHAGQICYPVVAAVSRGHYDVHVVLTWIDQSQPKGSREYGRDEFTGPIPAAEKWLREQGVRLDAQGIH
jgi:hypothetical protein